MIKSGSLLRLTMVLSLALGTSACSTISSLDPTGLLSDDSAPDSQFPEADAPQASDANVGTTPDLASLPDRPATINTAQRQQTAQSLAADGAQVQYSAEALRGGTEAAAPAPGAAGPAIVPVAAPPPAAASAPVLADNDAPPTADSAPPSAQIANNAPPSASNDLPPSAQPSPARVSANPNAAVPAVPDAAPSAAARVASVAPPPAARTPAPARAPASDAPPMANDAPPTASDAPPTAEAPTAAAPVAAASGGEPAVPANTPVRGGAARLASNQGVSDTELGFKPSTAPPLNPSINQWVAAPIVDRYRQTASNAGITTPTGQAAVPAVGAAIANKGSVTTGANGIAPTAVVYFPGDGVKLSAAARKEIRTAAQLFKASGGSATVRVIGHSSSRTANMSVEKHLETIFDKSQSRANAVAQELIHDGVPAARVLVEAVGDTRPVYYESMPQGEAGNRRAEIFVQS